MLVNIFTHSESQPYLSIELIEPINSSLIERLINQIPQHYGNYVLLEYDSTFLYTKLELCNSITVFSSIICDFIGVFNTEKYEFVGKIPVIMYSEIENIKYLFSLILTEPVITEKLVKIVMDELQSVVQTLDEIIYLNNKLDFINGYTRMQKN